MRLTPLIAMAIVFASCGGDDAPEQATTADIAPVTIPLTEENGSGRSGEARIEADGADAFQVVVTMNPGQTKTNNAHIHDVTCEEYRRMDSFSEQLGTVEDTLSTLRDGKSETTVKTALAERATGGFSINVHEPIGPYPVIACGDIPRR